MININKMNFGALFPWQGPCGVTVVKKGSRSQVLRRAASASTITLLCSIQLSPQRAAVEIKSVI